MVRPGRLKLYPHELDAESRKLLDRLARLRKLDLRWAELAAEQRSLTRDIDAEIARKRFTQSLLGGGQRRQGWDLGPADECSVSPAPVISIIKRCDITIRCLREIWARNQKHMRAIESTRSALRLLVKKR